MTNTKKLQLYHHESSCSFDVAKIFNDSPFILFSRTSIFRVKNLLEIYALPTNLNTNEIKKNKQLIQSNIYKNIFLDKKKISQFPRYIKLIKLGKAKVMEIKNFDHLNETIYKIIL